MDVPVGGCFLRHWRINGNWFGALYERTATDYMICRIDATGAAASNTFALIKFSLTDWGVCAESRIEGVSPGVIEQVTMLAIHGAYRRVMQLLGAEWLPEQLAKNSWLHGLT